MVEEKFFIIIFSILINIIELVIEVLGLFFIFIVYKLFVFVVYGVFILYDFYKVISI